MLTFFWNQHIDRFLLKSVTPALLLLIGGLAAPVRAQESDPPKITYEEHVKAILQQRCSSCHSPNRKESDLDVTNYTDLMMGGGSGEVISPGSADDSYLYRLIMHTDSPEMPPSGKIPDAEIKLIGDWIALGALENAGSKPRKTKPKLDLALSTDALTRPETVVVPLRIPVDPVVTTQRSAVLSLAASPWAPLLALSTPRQVLLYSTESQELLGILPFEEGSVHQLKFSRSGSLLLGAGGKDGKFGTTVLWNVATGERVATVGEELDVILAADISSNHELIAIGGPSKLVKILSVEDGSQLFEIKKHNEWVTAIEFSPDGKWLATGDRNGAIHVWETATGAELFALAGHTKSISGLSWRLDGKILASASEDTTVKTWELEKGGVVKNWAAHGGGVTDLQFLRDGNLASCGRDNLAKTWNQDGGLIKQFPNLADVAVALAFCNETNHFVAADWTGEIKVWNSEGTELGRLIANPPSLADRLKGAQEALANTMNKLTPLQAELKVTTDRLTELTSSLSEQQAAGRDLEAKIAQQQTELTEANTKMATLNSLMMAEQAEQQKVRESIPLVDAACEKLTAAAEAMKDDVELQQSNEQLQAKKNALQSRLVELDLSIPKRMAEQAELQKQIASMTELTTKETTELTQLNTLIADMMTKVAPLEQEVATQSAAVQTATHEVTFAEQMVAKWVGESQFIVQLQSLTGVLETVEQSIEEKLSAEEELQSKLQALEAQIKQAREQTAITEREAEEIRQQILKLRGGGE